MRNEITLSISIFIVIVLSMGIGWIGNDAYKYYSNQRILDGLRLEANSQINAMDKAEKADMMGDWVCVNIKGMEYKRAVEVCNHEVGHEIFAEECEKNITKCMDVVGK